MCDNKLLICTLFILQVTFSAKKASAHVDIYGCNAGETYIVFNATSSVNITK